MKISILHHLMIKQSLSKILRSIIRTFTDHKDVVYDKLILPDVRLASTSENKFIKI